MKERTISEKAERLSMRRARALPALAVIFLAQQASYLGMPGHSDRPVDHVKIGAWIALSIVLLAGLATGGAWFRPRAVRELVNDESTRAHRLTGYAYGFWAAMIAAILLYVLNMFEPLTGRDAVHVIVTAAIAAALIRFGILERRALKDA
jgi:magnesium-transporting ATPase (P-type)